MEKYTRSPRAQTDDSEGLDETSRSFENEQRLRVNQYKQTAEEIYTCVTASGLIIKTSYTVLCFLNMKINNMLKWKNWQTLSFNGLERFNGDNINPVTIPFANIQLWCSRDGSPKNLSSVIIYLLSF